METRANYIIVGIFTLVAFAGAFAFIWWVAQYNQGSDRVRLDVLIEGSASGLQPGSAVRYNGIRVGLVRRIYLPSDRPNLVIAETLVDPSTPVSTTTHALLGLPDLTGVAYIDLEGRREVGVDLLAKAREEGAIATIKADPSAISTLLASAQNILSRADSSMTEFEGFVKDARGPVYETVENVKTFSGALKDNAAGIDQFLEGATDLGRALTDISGKLDGT
ncbi:MAG TPA: MlaD family protein, partial [Rhizobiaceae bacterium]|nr:MlaD family protein [Rhizobiaceae bacterium]